MPPSWAKARLLTAITIATWSTVRIVLNIILACCFVFFSFHPLKIMTRIIEIGIANGLPTAGKNQKF
jgi:uncharacterized membrane protein